MEILVRFMLITVKIGAYLARVLRCFVDRCCARVALPPRAPLPPPISNRLLTLSLRELRLLLLSRQLSAVELVSAYIARIEAVNPLLNALVEERFGAALSEAAAADALISQRGADLAQLYEELPLLGLPFTVKESCALHQMSFAVGSLQRSGQRAEADGTAVARLRAAGAIALLVSATPEYCYSIETSTLQNGRCLNPYDLERTPGGTSGGEGALNGAGASLFGIGSDIAGSIRIPSLFCGVFGHKASAGVVSVEGHFPNSSDADFPLYLQLGPISRFADDLSELLGLMAGSQAAQLQLQQPVELSQLRVFYALGFEGFNGLMHQAVNEDIQLSIRKAVVHFKSLGADVQRAKVAGLRNSMEIALSGIAKLRQMPFVLQQKDATVQQTLLEYGRSLLGFSKYTPNALLFDLMRRTHGFMPKRQLAHYEREGRLLTEELSQMLGQNGVMFFPTMHEPAERLGWSILPLWGIDYTLIFNVLGLPVTHVPMGLNAEGLPIGFSVVAAPMQDRLCLSVAVELERVFGGWQPALPHELPN